MDTYFSVLFKSERAKLGYSIFDFARLLRIDVDELNMIENSEIIPNSEVLYRLEVLGS